MLTGTSEYNLSKKKNVRGFFVGTREKYKIYATYSKTNVMIRMHIGTNFFLMSKI